MVKCLVNGMRDTATERSVHRYVRTCTRSTQFRSIGSRQCWSVSPWYSSSVYTALIYSNKNMSIVIETVSWPCSLAPVQPSTIHVGVAESAEEKKKIKMDREQIIRMLSNRGVGRCTCVLHAPHKVCELICMWDRHNVNISTLLHRQAGKKKHKLPVYRELMNVSRVLWCKWRYRKICFSLITSFLIEFQHLCSRVRTHPALATSPTPLPPLSVFLARGFFWTANSVIRQLWHDWNWINGGERMREATKKLYF